MQTNSNKRHLCTLLLRRYQTRNDNSLIQCQYDVITYQSFPISFHNFAVNKLNKFVSYKIKMFMYLVFVTNIFYSKANFGTQFSSTYNFRYCLLSTKQQKRKYNLCESNRRIYLYNLYKKYIFLFINMSIYLLV